jgi:signal transduction histidine kinase
MQIQEQGNILIYIFGGTAIIALFILAFIAFFAFYKKRLTQKESQIIQLENDYRFKLIQNTIQTEEAGKIRLANNLHDELGSMLTVLKYAINNLEARTPGIQNTENVHQVLDQLILDFKIICRDLVPSSIKNFGLLKTLIEVINVLELNTNITFVVTSNQIDIKQELEREISIYRLFKEVINNIIKHSEPNQLQISINQTSSELNINIVYNGKGITNEEIQKIKFNTTSVGIQSIDTRLLFLNGKIDYLKELQNNKILIQIPTCPIPSK